VFDPQGLFASTNQNFSVVQKVLPQGITGHIAAVTTNGAALSNTLVGIASLTRNLVSSQYTETDSNGNFTIYTLPDTYNVEVVKDGFITDQSVAVVVQCGQFTATNLAYASASLTLSGTVTDGGTGQGIGGLTVSAKDSVNGNLEGVAFTATNGHYSVSVTPSNAWRLRVGQAALAQAGYLALANRTNVVITNTSLSNINFSFAKPTAIVFGTVKDDHGNPVPGCIVDGSQIGGSPPRESDGVSVSTNGNYSVGLAAGTWALSQLPDQLAQWGLTGALATNVTLSNSQTLALNVVLTRTNFPSLAGPARDSPSQVHFALTGLPAVNYLVQFSTNLSTSNWFPLRVTNGGCAPVMITDSQATNTARYYRALILP
jgi:hypothetical protein